MKQQELIYTTLPTPFILNTEIVGGNPTTESAITTFIHPENPNDNSNEQTTEIMVSHAPPPPIPFEQTINELPQILALFRQLDNSQWFIPVAESTIKNTPIFTEEGEKELTMYDMRVADSSILNFWENGR